MKRKLIAFMTAVLALLSVSPVSVFATVTNSSAKIEVQGMTELPKIVVTIPTGGQLFINPYQLPVEIDGESTTEQIVSSPVNIENGSKVPLNVDVTVVGTINEDSDMTLNTMTLKNLATTAKKAFIYFEMQAVSDPGQVEWDSAYNMSKHLLVRTTSSTKKSITTLEQADKPNHFGAFRLTGDCVPTPKSSWTEADGITVTIAFTFTPLKYDYS